MKAKVAAIGDADFVMPFSALGIDTFAVDQTKQQLAESAQKITEGGYALVVVAEDMAPAVEQHLAGYRDQPLPLLLVVPFTTESSGLATENLANVLKLATGIDILKNQ